jgi:hypothetical protein
MFVSVLEVLFFVDFLSGWNSCFLAGEKSALELYVGVWIFRLIFFPHIVAFEWVEHQLQVFGEAADTMFDDVKA